MMTRAGPPESEEIATARPTAMSKLPQLLGRIRT